MIDSPRRASQATATRTISQFDNQSTKYDSQSSKYDNESTHFIYTSLIC